MSSNYHTFPFEQPCPPVDPKAGLKLRPAPDPEPQPTETPGSPFGMVRDGQLFHLGWSVGPRK